VDRKRKSVGEVVGANPVERRLSARSVDVELVDAFFGVDELGDVGSDFQAVGRAGRIS